MEKLSHTLSAQWQRVRAWATREEHQRKAAELREEVNRAFTEHPAMTGETYFEHLWFTVRMAGRFVYTTTVLVIHGVFPFLLTKAASTEIEKIYGIMKRRIPKNRLEQIDMDYQV